MSEKGEPRWWKPWTVLREAERLKQEGRCPVCEHDAHRDGPCGTCADLCRYPQTLHAAQDRFAEARGDLKRTLLGRLGQRRTR